MRYEAHEQLKAPRVATHFPSSLREEANPNTNVYMLVEDVQLAVMPIGGESRRSPNFSVEIQSSSEHKTRAIAILKSLISRNGYSRHSLEELLSASVAELARKLAWHGRAIHEIIRDVENGEACLLHGFTPRRLFRAFGRYIQIIPKDDRRLWNKAYVIIPKKDIWDIAMPKVLGGCRSYCAMLRKLARFSPLGPSFLTDESSEQEWPAHYAPQRYVQETKFFEAKITARWGWNRWDSTLQNSTEFYWVYRSLTLKWAQACMREHIVKELNRLFQRLSIEAEIVMKGLPTAREILEVQQRMCEGNVSFTDASNECSV